MAETEDQAIVKRSSYAENVSFNTLNRIPKKTLICLDQNILASGTMENTRTVLGTLQPVLSVDNYQLPIAFSKLYNASVKEFMEKFNFFKHVTRESSYLSIENCQTPSLRNCDETENVSPESVKATRNFDYEITPIIHGEKTIKVLQEKILSIEQENAILKLQNFKNENELKQSVDIINQMKDSWDKIQEYFSFILQKELSATLKDVEILKENERQHKSKLDENATKFTEKFDSLKKELETQTDLNNEYRKEILSYQNELFTSQKENQDMMRLKVSLETEKEEEISELKKKLKSLQLINEEHETEIENLHKDVENVKNDYSIVFQKLRDIITQKDVLKMELQKSQAHKVTLNEENKIAIENTLQEKEMAFQEIKEEFNKSKSKEIQEIKTHYENVLRDTINLHNSQIEDLLLKVNESKIDKEKCLAICCTQLQRATKKIQQLEAGRNKVLSGLQIHLQNQWRESVALLYPDNDNTVDQSAPEAAFPTEINFSKDRCDWLRSPDVLFNSPVTTETSTSPRRRLILEDDITKEKLSTPITDASQ